MLLRARVVVPVSQPPIDNGAVLISGRRIRAVGPWRELARKTRQKAIDLCDVALLPGLINAHCHLDYTDMAGLFESPRRFTDWIKLITAEKGQWSDEDFKISWGRGARMLERTGTTTVGDIEALPKLLPEVWDDTPLRVISFLEMTGIRSRRPPRDVLNEALAHIAKLKHARCKAWLSPHAPYSTMPELLRLATRTAARRRWRVTTHVAESDQEFQMFMHAQGEMHDWIRRNDRDNSDCGLGSPVQHMERNGALTSSLLAIHANYLAPGDADLLGKRGVHVIHCPRSHAFFRHQAFPFEALNTAGVNISLATDSLASVINPRRKTVWRRASPGTAGETTPPRLKRVAAEGGPATPAIIELNLFEEMRAFARLFPSVPPETILQMVTLNPARALGFAGKLGEIRPGAFADLIALPVGRSSENVCASIVNHTGNVSASMINGSWAITPPN
jgi:cytosine/adenosine deaminase-related metal-dependent hydrolase